MIVITGATGHVGRELVGMLAARGERVRALVRSPERATGLPEGVEHVVGDLEDPATLAAAFDGVDRLFLLVPGIRHEPARHALAAARTAGVRHVVYLSSYAVAADPMPAMGRWHHDREELVRAAGIPATVLRPCGFMSNTLDWLPTLRAGGYVLDPVGPGRAALIDPYDIAAVAAVALDEPGRVGGAAVLTGDQPLTVTEQAAVLAAAAGIEIEIRDVRTPEEAVRFRYPNGAPPALADALVEGLRLMRSDVAGVRTEHVQRILGRAPRSFSDWCERNADVFRTAVQAGRRPR
ncbi:NAD(P)H-binding protein [Nakamurella lactea]|uniref:NAD(P)H-binding protein n=1 Tax=Nakamurella lactea TaxID=459515 RepID=UPI000490028D|nr:NAD(P)H-binding protein [Nakamurella lactea]